MATPAPATYDFSKVQLSPDGSMVATGNGAFVSKSALNDNGYKMAVDWASKPPVIPGAGIVSGSSSVVTDENNTKGAVNGLNGTLPTIPGAPGSTPPSNAAAQTASDAIIKQISDYSAQLEQRRQDEIKGINESFDAAGKKLEGDQANETGSTTVGIARMGGYLGGSGSGTGVMLNLAKSHRDEVSALEAKRQTAIREANNAITDKQFELAKAKVAEVKDIENTLYQRNKDFWNQQLQLQQENRAQNTFLQSKFKDELSVLSTTGAATPEKAKEIDAFYGVPGFTKQYLDIVNADKKAKSAKEQLDSFKAKVDLLQAIPKGMQVKFGDETITGIGKAGDLDIYHVEDAAGNVTQVTTNKATGAITTQSLGKIGTPNSTGGGASSQDISAMASDLSSVADKNNHVTPTDYKNGLRLWLQAGKTLQSYEANFKVFADPNKAKEYDFSSWYNKPTDQLLQQLFGGAAPTT